MGLPPELREVQQRFLGPLDRVETAKTPPRATAGPALAGRVLNLSRFAVEVSARKEREERSELREERLKLAVRR
jgi:hypothetical protein